MHISNPNADVKQIFKYLRDVYIQKSKRKREEVARGFVESIICKSS